LQDLQLIVKRSETAARGRQEFSLTRTGRATLNSYLSRCLQQAKVSDIHDVLRLVALATVRDKDYAAQLGRGEATARQAAARELNSCLQRSPKGTAAQYRSMRALLLVAEAECLRKLSSTLKK
jgi:hypothetical protein